MSRSVVSSATTTHDNSRRVVHHAHAHHTHQQQQSPRQSSSSKTDDESIESDAVYASRYTSTFAKEDVLITKIHDLRHKTAHLLRKFAGPDPDDERGRPRYRDWEY